ncbi:hypothetical protein [Pilimelia anulata]|uniref:hypothetical protein n=1 Tax=Pilimelia anulata TaxID=53371 RepID=UPI00166BE227|nr:hypothetical protein [Pilimelia anulata]
MLAAAGLAAAAGCGQVGGEPDPGRGDLPVPAGASLPADAPTDDTARLLPGDAPAPPAAGDPAASDPAGAGEPAGDGSGGVPDRLAAAGAGCPGADALLAALRGNPGLAAAFGNPDRVGAVHCVDRYAFADLDGGAFAVFRADGAAWRAVNAGTARVCDDGVPPAVAAREPRCAR